MVCMADKSAGTVCQKAGLFGVKKQFKYFMGNVKI